MPIAPRCTISPTVLPPSSLPLADIAAPFDREGFRLSVAGTDEYQEVEALSRAADPGEVFSPITAPLLSWFIDLNPAGPGFLVLARSRRDGSLAGHFLFYATTLVHRSREGDRQVPAYLYVHLYVAPAFRRLGVFASMFGFGQQVLARMGVPFAYTVPNRRSSPGFTRFGVPLLGTLPVRMAPDWGAWKAVTGLVAPRGTGVEAAPALSFDDRMVAAARCDAEGASRPAPARSPSVCGVRTPDHLAWRFLRRPGAEYRVFRVLRGPATRGYVVARTLRIQKYRVLAICDIALDPFDAATASAALRQVRAHVREPVDLVMLQGGPRDRQSRLALLRAGFPRVPDRALPQPVAVFGGDPSRPGSTGGLPLLEDWELTPCDWDVF